MDSGDHNIQISDTNPFRFQLLDPMNNTKNDDNMGRSNIHAEDTDNIMRSGECSSAPHRAINSNSDEWYFDQPPKLSDCPFKSFHRSGLPSEFLQHPYYHSNDKRSQHILAGMNDHSSGVHMKIQFIVNNLKDCLGIWPQLFLQKLNAIIVHADHGNVRSILLKDNFAILKEVIDYYVNEVKCSMVFRYWCFLYNVLSNNLTPVLPSELKSQLMAQLQIDFSLASQNTCRCKLDVQCSSECEPDEEHRMIKNLTQMSITSVLMYYLICKVGDHSDSTYDIYKETPPKLNAEKFTKGILVHHYIKLFEDSSNDELQPILMETLAHVLIAFHNVPYEKNLFSSAIEVMLDMGYLSAAIKVKDMLLKLLQKEFDTFQNGPLSKLVFIHPEILIGFETLGVSNVIKCIDSLISNVEYQVLSRDEQNQLMNMMVAIQTYLGDSSFWNGDYENMYLHCRHLQCTLEKRLGFQMTDVKLDSDTETANESGIPLSDNLRQDSSGSSQTSQSKLHSCKYVSTGVGDNEMDDDWIVGTRKISKLRKGYAHEIHANGRQKQSWMSRILEFFVTCGKCCDFKD